MDDTSIAAIVAVGLCLSALCTWLALRPRLKLRQQAQAAPVAVEPDFADPQVRRIQVSSTFSLTSGFLWRKMSSSWTQPMLALAPEGLRYRTLLEGTWPYAEIEQVDVRRTLFGGEMRILFLGNGNRRVLAATLGGPDAARQVLKALPASLPLSVDAAILRDGTAAAATPGLRRYRGQLR
ncbi:hypothetical protein BH09PSE6_BH09PSE6_10890 [soil metagenome]